MYAGMKNESIQGTVCKPRNQLGEWIEHLLNKISCHILRGSPFPGYASYVEFNTMKI